MDERVRQNLEHWTELAELHSRPSPYYDIDGFRAGGTSLRRIELDEVGDVRGKRLLHLQCHIGLDTLSWARRGAIVTGIDFCDDALAFARQLAADCGIEARFLRADIDASPDLGEQFDIVFTSYGTTVWLPSLERWAALIARSLVPGGFFYIVDGHPFSKVLSNSADASVLCVNESYFEPPARYEGSCDYAHTDVPVRAAAYEWSHTLGDTITALARAGLRIEFLHEHARADCPYFTGMRPDADRYWQLPGAPIPHLFSIKASR